MTRDHHFKKKYNLAYYAIQYNCELLIRETQTIINNEGSAFDRLTQLLTKKRDIKRGCLVGQLAHDKQIMNQPELASKVTYTFKWIQNEIEQLLTIGIREGSISNIFSPFEGRILIMSLLQG
ncbi:hypothetical protein [Gilliamella sp. WF3-4]|jgi:TetR/AcrR family transcriptional regulator, transcriptional repressor for nem operon|uniref:hypothetical protein n=2 Tax=unclassified Gilliamella TaxID=2685620 RepID=UPI00080EE024|nr:hypothetical protein [Gilliamella apicola]OCG18445.1 hypothetical protein A9G47_05760 [Gilliamella apicola]